MNIAVPPLLDHCGQTVQQRYLVSMALMEHTCGDIRIVLVNLQVFLEDLGHEHGAGLSLLQELVDLITDCLHGFGAAFSELI
jgi:hypothetical protein